MSLRTGLELRSAGSRATASAYRAPAHCRRKKKRKKEQRLSQMEKKTKKEMIQ